MEKFDILAKSWDGIFYPNEWEDEDKRHTYWKGNKQFWGLTSTLIKLAFPNDYDGIPTNRMVAAAEFGSAVHESVENYELWGGEEDYILKMYNDIKKKYNLRHLASEFLVSDGKQFASAIDQIYVNDECEENEVLLVDLKCTSDRKEEKVALQLSYYADWFEKQTGYKVKGIYHMWFRKNSRKTADGESETYVEDVEFNEVSRVDSKELGKLKRAYLKGQDYEYNPYPKHMRDMATKLNKVYQKYLEAELELKQAKEEYMTAMQNDHHRTIKSGNMSVTIVSGKKSSRFNTTKFKKEHPDMVDDYMSESTSAPYLSITFNKK